MKPIPNRSGGGTFVRNKAGDIVEYIAPTKTLEQAAQEAAAAAASAAASTPTTSTDDAPRTSRRNRTGEE
jgi:type IV secretory pathway TrbL component